MGIGGDALKMDRVLQETLDTVERAREEIFYIAEDARRELEETRAELDRVRKDVERQIGEVERLQREDRQARVRLMDVTRDFAQRSEEEVRSAYERAKDVQTLLQVALERERHLRQLRDSLERRLRRLQQTVQRAESLVSQVTVAIKVLAGNLSELAVQVEGVRLRQALGVSIVRAQEEERRRLARDIHDGPAQLLANVAFRIEMCERLLETDLPRVQQELARLGELVRQSLQDVRKIIFDLRPMALDDLGLAPAVRGLAAELYNKTGLDCEVTVTGVERRLEQAIEIAAFRIVQEALTNVWKHAGTKKAFVSLHFTDDTVDIEVRDEGRGFDVTGDLAEPSGDHFGLVNISERVSLLQGQFHVRSAPGKGTRLRVTLPINAAAGDEEEGEVIVGHSRRRGG
ncbi:MAG TPA: sensor histidine kinase [Bacillota bacterium]